ncbi:MAG: sulfatase-like hydrolase/transferase, partial [Cytophagales bacterium]|nr:sulfatase-like hydrolase/transferase [Cytophagales bacterium]
CSDNGPAGGPGKTSGYRSNKGSLYEGGVRVPGFVTWPDRINAGRTTDYPIITTDYYSTTLDILGYPEQADELPLDGTSVKEVILNNAGATLPPREKPIAFNLRSQETYMDGQYKIYRKNDDWQLYDIEADGFETNDIAALHPDIVAEMAAKWEAWYNTVTMDGDHDRLPDDWETTHFVDTTVTDGKIDSDGDGASDLAEYIFGSDPNDDTSVPAVGLHVAPGMVPVVQYNRPSGNPLGITYSVVGKDSLSDGSWVALTNQPSSIVGLTNGTENVEVEVPGSSTQMFFRVEGETIN